VWPSVWGNQCVNFPVQKISKARGYGYGCALHCIARWTATWCVDISANSDVSVCVLTAAAVPHYKALMALSDHSIQQHESDMTSSDSSQCDVTDQQPAAHRSDHGVVNYGPAKAKSVH